MSQTFPNLNPQPGDTQRILEAKILTSINSGAGGAPTSINYAGPPITNPPLLANIVVDVNGRVWTFFNAGWH